MKAVLVAALACYLLVSGGVAQQTTHKAPAVRSDAHSNAVPGQPDSRDVEEMRADLERLKVLLNQMRTNLAFVQTSQTPLKHQFELDADAWQIMVEHMERRLKRMEDRSRESAH